MYLEELIGKISLENLEVECKARLDRSNPQSWIKTVGRSEEHTSELQSRE